MDSPADFWSAVWDYCGIVASAPYADVVTYFSQFPGAQWFPGARLNFAENLLKFKDDKLALVGLLETGERHEFTYAELYEAVGRLSAAMRDQGVEAGDRVAGFMPNICETVIAMLAASSIGAIWTACSPDFGIDAAKDRFGQVQPKLLFVTQAYSYNGKLFDCLAKVKAITSAISSVEKIIVIPTDLDRLVLPDDQSLVTYQDFINSTPAQPLKFNQLPFNHPLYIAYSSGTTGTPKCIIHSAGGTLLQHKKEHALHVDIRRDDVLFYFTTCGWMMWNWLVSGLASGCTLVLYEGSPFARRGRVLLDAIDAEGITVFGVSAKYIASLEKVGIKPANSHNLSTLKTILSTGSPLSASSYDYIYRDFKADVCLSSISGGTDILSCFALGNPNLPVYRGELQCRGLGMAVEFWDDEGNIVENGKKGELICTQPFPSVPIGFWNDTDDARFKASYFERWPNNWAHGDYGELTERGGVVIHGRSDTVLNPGGVRIGTAEIYRQVEKIDEVLDSVVVSQEWLEDERIILFIVLRAGVALDDPLVAKIQQTIRDNTSPRHVPAKVVAVTDIPRTISGKTVELAVKNVIHGRPVKNTDVLANPEALQLFTSLPELQAD